MAQLLIVEDHPLFGQSLCRMLGIRGNHTVHLITTAEDALQRLPSLEPDLVLIDISLPGQDGLWLLQQIQASRPEVPCMMLSGHLSLDYLREAMQSGARGYLVKDDLPGITAGIEAALSGRTYIAAELLAHSGKPPRRTSAR